MTPLLAALLSSLFVTGDFVPTAMEPLSHPSCGHSHGVPFVGPLPEGTRFVDRWGHPHEPASRPARIQARQHGDRQVPGLPDDDLIGVASNCNVPVTCSNGFDIEFEDVTTGTMWGFDDCTPVGATTLGAVRMNTACAVLDYVASIIDLGAATPDILVLPSLNDTMSSTIAFASPTYPVTLGPGFHGGNLRDHVVTGVDPTPLASDRDAEITVNFAITMNSDHTIPAGSNVDLFSVMLHELSHALGFASGIGQTGAGELPGGGYTLFDQFLRITAPAGPVLTNGTAYLGGPGDLTSNDVWYFEAGNVEDQPAYSPFAFEPKSSLSHFDPSRPTAASSAPQPFVMRPSYSGGDYREWTPQEIEVWCDLGYLLTNPGLCTIPHALGVDDFDVTTQATPVTTNVIANDVGGFAVAIGSVVAPPPSVGTVTVSGTDITFTPDPGFCGDATILYSPIGASGQPGTVAALTVTVNCTFCPEDPCNLVCNGGFEIAPDPCVLMYDFDTIFDGFLPNWSTSGGSPDLFSRQYLLWDPNPCDTPWVCTGTVFNPPGFGIPFSSFSCPGGIDSWNGVGNDHYIGMYSSMSASSVPSSEGVTAPLVDALVPGQTYELCFRARSRPGFGTSSPETLHVALNVAAPGAGSPHVNMPGNQVLTPALGSFNSWELLTQTFVANAAHAFITIEPQVTSGVTSFSNYVFIDDVRLVQDLPQLQVSKTVSDPSPEPGDTITYAIETCNVGKDIAINVEVQDLLPAGLSYAGGFSAYPNHLYPSSFLPGDCFTVNLAAVVEPTVPLNVPIDNCVSIVSPHADCVQPDGCATLEVAATDIQVQKTVTPSNPSPSGVTTFTITVTNLGPEPATGIEVLDPLGPCFGYDSHSLMPPIGGYSPVTGELVIPNLAVGQSVQLEIVAETLCTCAENCAELVAAEPYDFNPLNDRACVDVFTANVVIDGSVTPALASNVGFIPPGSSVFITGTFVHDLLGANYILDGCQVSLDTNARIEIPPGVRTLTLRDSSLRACTDMWDGIHVWATDAGVVVEQGSLIQDARNAIVSHDGGNFEIFDSTLDRNHVHVEVTPYPGLMGATISNSTLGCSAPLIAPHAGERTAVGVDVDQVGYLRIGENVAGAMNTFSSLAVGVRSRLSDVEIFNNLFLEIQPETAGGQPVPGTGIAVHAIGAPGGVGGQSFDLRVGGPSPGQFGNTFQNCYDGIDASEQLDTAIEHNAFIDTDETAVRVHLQRDREILVQFNDFRDFRIGIALELFRDCDADVVGNELTDTSGQSVRAFLADDVQRVFSSSARTHAWRNVVEGWGELALIQTSDHVSFSDNVVTMIPGASLSAQGVRVLGSEDIVVNGNRITANGSSGVAQVQAVFAAQSPRTRVTCNRITGAGVHVHAQGPAMAASTIGRNRMTTGLAAYVLSLLGFTGQQGALNAPSDNVWQTSFGLADTASVLSDGSLSPFVVRQGSPPHQPLVNLAFFGSPILVATTPPPFFLDPCVSIALKPGPGDGPALEAIAAGELGSLEELPALWEADRYFFETVLVVPELLENPALAEHHARLMRTNVPVVIEVIERLLRDEAGSAADLLGTMTPRGAIEQGYWDVLEAMAARLGHPVVRERSDEERLTLLGELAKQCIVDRGRAVTLARSELARRGIRVLDDDEGPCAVLELLEAEGRGRDATTPVDRSLRPRRSR
ncbi:MAG: hypothetical protein AAF533_23880 [Acidobacteriota bacterium]